MPAAQVYGGRLMWPAEAAERVLTAFREATATAPEELSMWFWLLNLPDEPTVPPPFRGRWAVAVDLTYLGAADDAEQVLRPFRSAVPAPVGALGTVPLAGLGAIAAEPTEPTPVLEGARLLNTFDADAAAAVLDAVRPDRPSPLAFVEIRHLGGALSRPPDGHGALGHLPEPYLMLCGGPVTDPGLAAGLRADIDRVGTALAPHGGDRVPPGFGEDAAAIYPPDVLARLRQLKRVRDPRGVIRSNRPVLAGTTDAPRQPGTAGA
jgi:hypothetical protein